MYTQLPPTPRPRPTVAAILARHARRTGFAPQRTYGDVYAEAITALSGDAITLDTTEQTLVALKRARVITGKRLVALLGRHLADRRS